MVLTNGVRGNGLRLLCLLLALVAGCTARDETTPMRKYIREAAYASGTVQPEDVYQVAAPALARVVRVWVKPGDTVAAGQALVTLYRETALSAVEQAAARSDYTRRNVSPNSAPLTAAAAQMASAASQYAHDSVEYERIRRLWERQVIERRALDMAELKQNKARLAADAARAEYRRLQEQLALDAKNAQLQLDAQRAGANELVLYAERSGVVYNLDVEAGEIASPAMPLMTIGRADQFFAELFVDEADAQRININQHVYMTIEGARERVLQGSVRSIDPFVEQRGKTVRVEVDAANLPRMMGLSVEANILLAEKNNALVLPAKYLIAGDSVRVSIDGETATRKVGVGLRGLDMVEITSGLEETSVVIAP